MRRHLNRLAVLITPVLALACAAAWFGWINAREHRVTASGWVVIVIVAVGTVCWARALPFPCPKCGWNLVPLGGRSLRRVCPGCGLSLDTAWEGPAEG
jgi:hypothetical protein